MSQSIREVHAQPGGRAARPSLHSLTPERSHPSFEGTYALWRAAVMADLFFFTTYVLFPGKFRISKRRCWFVKLTLGREVSWLWFCRALEWAQRCGLCALLFALPLFCWKCFVLFCSNIKKPLSTWINSEGAETNSSATSSAFSSCEKFCEIQILENHLNKCNVFFSFLLCSL